MDPVVASFAQLVGVNDYLLGKALDGLSAAELRAHPGEANPMGWIVGHIAGTRNLLAQALGGGIDLPWAARFAQRSQPQDDASGDPDAPQLLAALRATSADLMARFAQLGDDDLAKSAPREFPVRDKTVRGMIAFLVYHEAYHVGQVAYVKKWLGYPGVVDGQ